jgi:hypothetical protein
MDLITDPTLRQKSRQEIDTIKRAVIASIQPDTDLAIIIIALAEIQQEMAQLIIDRDSDEWG